MPALEPHEELELEWKLAQMEADVALKKAQTRKAEQDWRLDPTRVVFSAAVAAGVIMGAVGTILGWLLRGSH